MHVRLDLVAIAEDGIEQRQELADLDRGAATIETLGLTLEESKRLLAALQRAIVARQVAGYLDDQQACPLCGKRRQLKEHGTAPFRTLFGLVSLSNPRWRQCPCRLHTEQTPTPQPEGETTSAVHADRPQKVPNDDWEATFRSGTQTSRPCSPPFCQRSDPPDFLVLSNWLKNTGTVVSPE